MLRDIQPYHNKQYLCIDDIVKIVSEYFGKDYMYMHAKGLGFTYYPKIEEGKAVLNKVRTSCNYPTYLKNFTKEMHYLKDFVGLDVEYMTDLTKEELLFHITKNIKENHPVAIISNTYYLPWHEPYYRKVRKLHTFLVTDIKDKTMLCVDGVLTQHLIQFEFEKLEDYKGILIFKDTIPQKELNLYNITNQIVQELKRNSKLDNCDSIRNFAKDVNQMTLLESEMDMFSDLDYSDFMIGLKSMEYGRKNFGDLILYLADRYGEYQEELFDIHMQIEAIAKQWKMVVVFLAKGYYAKQIDSYRKRAYTQLLEIAKAEEDVTKKIVSLKENIQVNKEV